MKTYAIGDLQGCAHEAQLLLDRIFETAGLDARILFVGDLINRGPDSLTALRRMKALNESSGGRVDALLGNHDLHLIAVAGGAQRLSRSDTLDEILAAPDRDELIAWLRARPLAMSGPALFNGQRVGAGDHDGALGRHRLVGLQRRHQLRGHLAGARFSPGGPGPAGVRAATPGPVRGDAPRSLQDPRATAAQ